MVKVKAVNVGKKSERKVFRIVWNGHIEYDGHEYKYNSFLEKIVEEIYPDVNIATHNDGTYYTLKAWYKGYSDNVLSIYVDADISKKDVEGNLKTIIDNVNHLVERVNKITSEEIVLEIEYD